MPKQSFCPIFLSQFLHHFQKLKSTSAFRKHLCENFFKRPSWLVSKIHVSTTLHCLYCIVTFIRDYCNTLVSLDDRKKENRNTIKLFYPLHTQVKIRVRNSLYFHTCENAVKAQETSSEVKRYFC